MPQHENWHEVRKRRLTEPGAKEAYEAARPAFELDQIARDELVKRDREWDSIDAENPR